MTEPPIHLWGVKANLTRIMGGYRNIAFQTAGLQRDWVFKTTRRTPDAIQWLLPVLSAAEQSGFVVPRLVKSISGRYVEDGWTCEPLIHGKAFQPADLSLIKPHILDFHKATKNIPQRPGFRSSSDLLHCMSGGDIDLTNMPADIVAKCRDAWSHTAGRLTCVVHGDLNPNNLIMTGDKTIALIDWDECRVDAELFDRAALNLDSFDRVGKIAALAWEVACCWHTEPIHAKDVAAKFMRL
jgi:hypothetical protein